MPGSEELPAVEEQQQAEFYACILEPGGGTTQQDAAYVGQRRLLLYRKALSGNLQRQVGFPSEDFVPLPLSFTD